MDLVVFLALLAAQAAAPADSLEQEHVTGTLGVALDPQDSTSYIGFDPNTGTQTRLHFDQGGALSVQMADGRIFSLTR